MKASLRRTVEGASSGRTALICSTIMYSTLSSTRRSLESASETTGFRSAEEAAVPLLKKEGRQQRQQRHPPELAAAEGEDHVGGRSDRNTKMYETGTVSSESMRLYHYPGTEITPGPFTFTMHIQDDEAVDINARKHTADATPACFVTAS